MLISVAICTWNRCDLLKQALDQMTHLKTPASTTWELLVVNNNCTDKTDDELAKFVVKLPLRRLFERQPGQSNARNCAIREARGDYIVWTDDDTLVEPDWLTAYVSAFHKWPRAAFFGGPIRPWFPTSPPAWLTCVWPRIEDAYAIRDFGELPMPCQRGKCIPFGANFAVRSDVQRCFNYDPDLGLRPGGSARGDESTILNAILDQGYEGWWVPGAQVRHYIPPDRMTTRYLHGYYFGHGQLLAMNDKKREMPSLFGRPRWLWKRIVTAQLKYWARRHTRSPKIWIEDLIEASLARGMFKGYSA